MQPHWKSLIILLLLGLSSAHGQAVRSLHETRQTSSDLELSGELAGLPPNSTRYLTRDDLLTMPQVNFTVTDDTNFSGAVKIRGVKLEDLARRLGASPSADIVVAICDDGYRAHYTRAYLVAHHPVLVLQVNDEPPSGWPKAAEDHTSDMGPYMISHPKFATGGKGFWDADEPQIPWGVVRIEFRDEKTVFGAIAPSGVRAREPDVQVGFQIARQNCFRCHNAGDEGGQKAKRSWVSLGERAAGSPSEFAAYIRNPRSKNPNAQMPGYPQYDEAAIRALITYFLEFSPTRKP